MSPSMTHDDDHSSTDSWSSSFKQASRRWAEQSSSSSSTDRTSMELDEVTDEKYALMREGQRDGTKSKSESRSEGAYERSSFINPDIVRDIIIGLSDGLTVPFALTAGLSGLDNAKIVVIGGFAELVSGAISMGVGGMLSAQAELDHYRHMQAQTAQRVKSSSTLQEDVRAIFAPLGLSAETSARVAAELQAVEEEDRRRDSQQSSTSQSLPQPCIASSSQQQQNIRQRIFRPQRGLTPLLLQMGEGLEEIEEQRVWQSALTIGLSYFIGGFIPLLPYLFTASVSSALFASIAITAFVLVVFGVVKQKVTSTGDWKSLTKSALSTLAVGAAAAGSSWTIVRLLEA